MSKPVTMNVNAEEMKRYAGILGVKPDQLPLQGRLEVDENSDGTLEITITGPKGRDGTQQRFVAGLLGNNGKPDPARAEMHSGFVCLDSSCRNSRLRWELVRKGGLVSGTYPDGSKILHLRNILLVKDK